MSYLVQFSIGPVQSFIEASRKTRDLAAGSSLLVSLSREVVAELASHNAKFIFPADKDAAAANVILVEMDADPQPIADAVKGRVRSFLQGEFDEATSNLGDLVRRDVATKQIEVFPEVFAAWVSLQGDYRASRRRLGAILAARKSTRDFATYPVELNQPKSPLAPQFDGVMKTGDGWQVDSRAAQRAGLKPREHLDAVSLIKRLRKLEPCLAPEDMRLLAVKGFPSTRLIAVLDLLQSQPEKCEALRNAIKAFDDDLDLGDAMFTLDDPGQECAVAKVRSCIYTDGKPRPYYAVIHADGDRMGELLDSKTLAQDHRDVSDQLSKFAGQVPEIVRRNHGVPVYSGGDDVLAFSTVYHAVTIAAQLTQAFKETVEGGPTLTVGVAICHVTDDLQSCVDFARSLERQGKRVPGKNALAVGVRVRSGSETQFAQSWNDNPQDLMREIVGLFAEQKLTRGFPYELRELARELNGMASDDMTQLIHNEVNRIYHRKNPKVKPEEHLALPEWVTEPVALKRYADLLAIAHFMTRRGDS